MIRYLCSLTYLFIFLSGCNNFPRDPYNTLEKVRTENLRAGAISNDPWVIENKGKVSGIEVDLVESFARSINTSVSWQTGSAEQIIPMLEEGQLDIIVGGLTRESHWKEEVGFTRPYLVCKVLIGLPPGGKVLSNIQDQSIGVKKGENIAALVSKNGGRPVPVRQLKDYPGPVAGLDFLLRKNGFQLTELVLKKENHVMAIRQGENAFLFELEKFLDHVGK